MARLLDFLTGVVAESQREDFSSSKLNLRPRLLPACFQACAFLGSAVIALNPALLCPSLSRTIALLLFITALLGGSLTLLLVNRLRAAALERLRTACGGLAHFIATISLTIGVFASPLCEPAAALMLLAMGFSSPFALLSWSLLLSTISREDALFNSLLGFVVIDLFLVFSKLVPQLFPLAVLACLVAGFAIHFSSPTPLAEIDSSDEAGPAASATPHSSPTSFKEIGSLLCSVPFLGVLLLCFTAGLVAWQNTTKPYPALLAGAILTALILVIFIASRDKAGSSTANLAFMLFDVGVPGMAIIGFAIKMIPLEFFSQNLFAYFMETYFMVLSLAFWVSLVFSGMANRRFLPFACGIACACAATALSGGALLKLADPWIVNIVLGLLTALFLILATISTGYSLVLRAKGAEPEDGTSSEPSDLSKICLLFSEDHQLTPRETEVLEELAYGHSSSYIAKALYISNNTARSHMKNIYKKLKINSREELIELLRERQAGSKD